MSRRRSERAGGATEAGKAAEACVGRATARQSDAVTAAPAASKLVSVDQRMMLRNGASHEAVCQRYYCSVEVTGKNRHEDHFEPRSRGGTDLRDNKVPACGTCNALNHDRGSAS